MDPASTETLSAAGGPPPFAAQLHARLRQRIIRGELPPGTRLSEQEIADQCALSRQPVREAFIRLAGEGLLEVRPQRGTFVTRIDMEWVLCTRFIRESVEADIVRLAAACARQAQHEALFDQIARQEAEADPAALAQLDEEFHATLAAIAGKARVWNHLQQMKMHLDRARHLLTAMTPKDIMLSQHRAVTEAIAARDPDRAEAAIRQHLRRVLLDLPGVLRLSPDYFTRTDTLAETLAAEA
ncbi:GntR family transcriptional regulator [Paracoccus sp. P2]|uniref:GntR family transcriptional regulator n=1 Tax=Paracoccus pantotrophus TaxID=82367 RepID=A0A7H9C2L7_PARPN|nr:GntR family transcriptional regulator [Paracoccus pantotrophus]QLH16301.1 GntR family transcriptional regulator [Paracoccus pantotrophus]RDE02088.1 GntR family transcriptional regulator [Paracoccus pantotrophus]WGR64330.1 GntR family transcriptional regulator [Paracoccus pantotrophus]